MTRKLIITIVFLLFSPFLQAEISISVDRNPVVADESFKLIFESDKKIKDDPDFEPLKKIFTVLNTGHRSNTQIINGDIKQSHQWILTVIANKTGIVKIPPIRFGSEYSKPSQVKVVASAPPTAGSNTEDVFVDVEVNTIKPYVQAQVIYTVKLYRAVQTNNATLSDPVVSGGQAVINKLGEDKSFETRIKGKRYVVIQRQYAIFPQSSGVLKIEPILFQGQTGSGSFFGFDPFGPQPKSIIKRSEGIELDIKPIPDSFTGETWLPASQLNIQEQWSVDPGKLKQGEATTRTLTLTANGLASSHLPLVDNQLPENLKQYPDQPELEESNNENGFVGIRRDKMAIIPTEAGDYILPAIKIPWWNTETDKLEIAELPERSIHVNVSDVAAVDNVQQQQIEKEVIAPVAENADNKVIVTTETTSDSVFWKWISLFLFILWLITLIVFWKSKHKTVTADTDSAENNSTRHYLKQFKQACTSNKPDMARQALLNWAQSMWPDKKIMSIDTIKEFCNEELQLKIDELNACLYGKTDKKWNGDLFLKSFESQKFDKKVTAEEKGKLEPLYKT
jgi:oxygen tolerance protein BatD